MVRHDLISTVDMSTPRLTRLLLWAVLHHCRVSSDEQRVERQQLSVLSSRRDDTLSIFSQRPRQAWTCTRWGLPSQLCTAEQEHKGLDFGRSRRGQQLTIPPGEDSFDASGRPPRLQTRTGGCLCLLSFSLYCSSPCLLPPLTSSLLVYNCLRNIPPSPRDDPLPEPVEPFGASS